MRPPVDTIAAPPFPKDAGWLNVASLRMEKLARHPVLIAFWDVCDPGSLRTLPYLVAWNERYAADGLRVVAVHASAFDAGNDPLLVAGAVAELGLELPVLLDPDFKLWRAYDNPGWPARYLFAHRLRLFDVHHGEGDYHGTERAILDLLERDGSLTPLADPADDDDAPIVVPTASADGGWDGAYAAGEVWVVVDRPGTVFVDGSPRELGRVGAHRLVRHERHAHGRITIEAAPGVEILRTAFLPGLASRRPDRLSTCARGGGPGRRRS
jgi:hypothetical protein